MTLLSQIGGFSSIFVASVLWVNGIFFLGKISKKTVVFINLFVSFIILATSTFSIFSSYASTTSVTFGAITLLFSCTYFWLAFNLMQDIEDMIGLGWFSLLVGITMLAMFFIQLQANLTFWYVWNQFDWLIWCILFFLFFLLSVPKLKLLKVIGYYSIFAAIVTAFLPGFLNLMANIK